MNDWVIFSFKEDINLIKSLTLPRVSSHFLNSLYYLKNILDQGTNTYFGLNPEIIYYITKNKYF